MTVLGLRFTPDAVDQLLAADEWWRENREKSSGRVRDDTVVIVAVWSAVRGYGPPLGEA